MRFFTLFFCFVEMLIGMAMIAIAAEPGIGSARVHAPVEQKLCRKDNAALFIGSLNRFVNVKTHIVFAKSV